VNDSLSSSGDAASSSSHNNHKQHHGANTHHTGATTTAMNVEQRKRLSSQQQSTVNRLALPKKREVVVSVSGVDGIATNIDSTINGGGGSGGKEINRASTPQSLVSDSVNENTMNPNSTNTKDSKKVSSIY
jgi:hypothetical protein